jgi:phosphoserine phosphatase
MLHQAGLGVAWCAKTKVQLEAPTRLNGESLTEDEIKELTESED